MKKRKRKTKTKKEKFELLEKQFQKDFKEKGNPFSCKVIFKKPGAVEYVSKTCLEDAILFTQSSNQLNLWETLLKRSDLSGEQRIKISKSFESLKENGNLFNLKAVFTGKLLIYQ
ncbi:MAG: hypothetical protein NTZ44_03625 [Candidatus Nomurabacteria bacterium]|nr:hypothetical protein [Candidatus Nomurabacteria bacterium]